MAYGKQTMWPEYWFIVPTKQILNLYKFLRCWFPEVYGHFDLEEIHEMGMELVPEPEIDFLDEVRQNIILDFTDDINFSDRPDSGGGRCGQHQHRQPQSERDPQDHDSQQHRHGPLPPRHVRAVPALLGRPAEASVPPHPASDPGTHLEPRLLHAHARLLAGLAVPRVRAAGLPGAAGGAGHGARRVRRLHLRAAAAQRQVPGNRGVLALHILPIIQGGSFDTSKNRCIAVRYSFVAELLYSMRIMHHYLQLLRCVQVYQWTGENSYIMRASPDTLVIGSSEGGFGLWLDGGFSQGRSQHTATFDNRPLPGREDFVINNLECWSFQ